VAFEMSYEGGASLPLLQNRTSFTSSAGIREKDNPGLQLAERTVHSCGGSLVLESEEGRKMRLRIVLPRNATRMAHEREVVK
jgi:two-component sensor histidine kinase